MYQELPSPFDNDERVAFREMVSKFVANEIAPYAAEWDENEEFPRELPVADVSMLKVQSTLLMEFCAREASQVLGGASYMRDNPVERIYREVRVMAIGGGSEEILRDLAARQMDI